MKHVENLHHYEIIVILHFSIYIFRLKKVIEYEPDNELAHYNLGMIAMDNHDMTEAEHWLKKSIVVSSYFPFVKINYKKRVLPGINHLFSSIICCAV